MNNRNSAVLFGKGFCWSILLIAFGLLALNVSEATAQQKYLSVEEAVQGLVGAVRSANDDTLLEVLGTGAEDLIASGDQVADTNNRAKFLKAFEEKYAIVHESDKRAVLHVGNKDYALPIPIIRQGESWTFDAEQGREEILNRRIGRNELATVDVLYAYTDAQREYACLHRPPDAYMGFFARQFISSPGKKDGLYWSAGEGEPESPFGPLIAKAVEHGYAGRLNIEDAEPFNGYFFKILTRQGDNAPGGAYDYLVDGKLVLGFGLVAYPAQYGSTGVMTFIVNQKGVVYQKDLGEKTRETAAAMTMYDPDDTWKVYEEERPSP